MTKIIFSHYITTNTIKKRIDPSDISDRRYYSKNSVISLIRREILQTTYFGARQFRKDLQEHDIYVASFQSNVHLKHGLSLHEKSVYPVVINIRAATAVHEKLHSYIMYVRVIDKQLIIEAFKKESLDPQLVVALS